MAGPVHNQPPPVQQPIGIGIGQVPQDQDGVVPMGEHQAEVGQAQPRATSALKTAWMDVKHFFTSLFGSRVSTPTPLAVTNGHEATDNVLHELTRSKPNEGLVYLALAEWIGHNPFQQDASRDGLRQEVQVQFGDKLDDMSDMQLFRLYRTLQNNPSLVQDLGQNGSAYVMSKVDDMNDPGAMEIMQACGKVNDMGGVVTELAAMVKDRLEGRGYETPHINGTGPTPFMDRFTENAVLNSGDLVAALRDTVLQNNAEKDRVVIGSLEVSGLRDEPKGPQRSPGRPQDATTALEDPFFDDPFKGTGTDGKKMIDFFDKHFEVCSSPEFWSHFGAKTNQDNFGSAMALACLSRIAGNGEVTPRDLEDLRKALSPPDDNVKPLAQLPLNLIGTASDERMKMLSQLVFDRYFAMGSPFELNLEPQFAETGMVRDTFADPTKTGQERFDALNNAFVQMQGRQRFPMASLTDPLRGIAG
ncbi:hypothetical protein [Prosthecomicrobium hirschii]|uniref:hypothetical protein n=1 Tax=Prosthecodimorpha hirschii TaxID=665126 RepID=UPI00221FBD42|nr:hypothetical protein [Prosthecomicrobium hirschii]MCW1838707.1 hypothetical protein [Prosthecomicrobium hirschii]